MLVLDLFFHFFFFHFTFMEGLSPRKSPPPTYARNVSTRQIPIKILLQTHRNNDRLNNEKNQIERFDMIEFTCKLNVSDCSEIRYF